MQKIWSEREYLGYYRPEWLQRGASDIGAK